MKFYEDTVAERSRIEAAIKRWGYAAEHNYSWYQYYQHYYQPPQRNIFVETDLGALFVAYNEKDQEYFVVFDPLAAPEHRVPLLAKYIDWVFRETPAKKIWFQLDRARRREFLRALPETARSRRIYYSLLWPIYDLDQFDPQLPGGHYKTLRKELHRFYREHQVSVADAKTYADRQALHAVIDNWKQRRPNSERGMTGVYHQAIDANFAGTDEARVFVVDGKAVGINAGWMVPNTSRFYGAIGIHDYSMPDLGAMLYLEDLVWLKEHGYREADMGGSEKSLAAFKNKFCPQRFYETAIFSISKKREESLVGTRPHEAVILK